MNRRDINQIEKPKKLEDSSINDINQKSYISNIMEVNKDESND